MPLLTIEKKGVRKKKPNKDEGKHKVILIVARSMPADCLSSYLIEKLILLLLSEEELAVKLRKRFVFKIIPMACIDGVILGNTYTTITGIDINKDWKEPDPIKNPVIYELKRYLRRLENKKNMQIFFFLDIKTCLTRPHTYFETNEF